MIGTNILRFLAGFSTRHLPSPASPSWQRTNFRGEPVSLCGGLNVAVGVVSASLLTPGRMGTAGAIAGASGALAGYIDDHREQDFATAKGLSGHLSALANGQVTTGVLKIGIIGTGAGISALVLRDGKDQNSSAPVEVADWVVRVVAIAGSANLLNLLDLRPGRALKAATALSILVAPGHGDVRPLLSGVTGTVAGALPSDLAGKTMLGDLGANAVGAVIGVAAASHPSRAVRLLAAAGTVGLILASEKVSFSRVIESNRILSAVDRWGR